MNDPKAATFTKTQRQYLTKLVNGPRRYDASDTTFPLLERKGFVRRLAGPMPGYLKANSVIEWEITETGRAKLREG